MKQTPKIVTLSATKPTLSVPWACRRGSRRAQNGMTRSPGRTVKCTHVTLS